MINKYPLWKYLLLAAVLLAGCLFALPNLYGDDPAVQISPRNGELDPSLSGEVARTLEAGGVEGFRFRPDDGRLLVLFEDGDSQLKARDLIQLEHSNRNTVALNLVPATPDWLRDVATAIAQTEAGYIDEFRTFLRTRQIRFRGAQHTEDGVNVRFDTAEVRDQALAAIRPEYFDLDLTTSQSDGSFIINAKLSEIARENERRAALDQNIITLRNRVNELGVAEPIVQQQGRERIVVQLPGVQDTTVAKDILGATATLEYRMVAQSAGPNTKEYRVREDVFINLDGAGAKRMQTVSADNIGNPMAVVFIENQISTEKQGDEYVKKRTRVEEVINVATIRDVLSHRFQTTGLATDEARNLSLLLRAGALKAPVEIVEERTVGPSLGQENIDRGKTSVLIGLALVLVFMAIYYKAFGIIADLALVTNLVLIVALLSMLPTSLTLPGIAGIVLTVGMAVDANVLIFERIRLFLVPARLRVLRSPCLSELSRRCSRQSLVPALSSTGCMAVRNSKHCLSSGLLRTFA